MGDQCVLGRTGPRSAPVPAPFSWTGRPAIVYILQICCFTGRGAQQFFVIEKQCVLQDGGLDDFVCYATSTFSRPGRWVNFRIPSIMDRVWLVVAALSHTPCGDRCVLGRTGPRNAPVPSPFSRAGRPVIF